MTKCLAEMVKKKKTNKVVSKTISRDVLSNEMVDWLLAHGKELDSNISLHDPVFVQCVEELKPSGFYIVEIEGDEYIPVELLNDFLILTPKDLKALNQRRIKIDEQE